jgi:hypothetical protein
MAQPLSDPVDHLVDQLVERHGITPCDAVTVLRRAARRKDVTLEALAFRVVHGSVCVAVG